MVWQSWRSNKRPGIWLVDLYNPLESPEVEYYLPTFCNATFFITHSDGLFFYVEPCRNITPPEQALYLPLLAVSFLGILLALILLAINNKFNYRK